MAAVSDYESELRERFDTVVVSSGSQASTFHVPADTEEPSPACTGTHQQRTKWLEKPLTIYPEGWMEACAKCTELLRE